MKMHTVARVIVSVLFPLLVIVLLARTAYADVVVTEVMYDPPGTDTGHEWVEIMNDGDAPVMVQDLRFVEADVRHRIKELSGESGAVIAPGEVAVIVQDGALFKDGYRDYQGLVLLSSFSLRQQEGIGELLGVYNISSDQVEHAVSYVPDDRAGGTGASLHLTLDGTQVPAPATPGSIAINPIAGNPVVEPAQEAVEEGVLQEHVVPVAMPEAVRSAVDVVSEVSAFNARSEVASDSVLRQAIVVQETDDDRHGVYVLWFIAILLGIAVLELFVIAERLRGVRRVRRG